MTIRQFNEEKPITGLEVVGDKILSLVSGQVLQALPGDFTEITSGTKTQIINDFIITETNLVWEEKVINLDTELS